MQPGAEDEQASQAAREAGLNITDEGNCILVALSAKQPSKCTFFDER